MQSAIYAWHYRKQLKCFYILYIMRGKCLRTEFKVEVKLDDEGRRIIYVDGQRWTKFTLDDVFDSYKSLATYLANDQLPPRDYDLSYDDLTMIAKAANGELSKTLKTSWDKYWQRLKDVKAGKAKRKLKRPEGGDWQCSYCSFQSICYDKNKRPYKPANKSS